MMTDLPFKRLRFLLWFAVLCGAGFAFAVVLGWLGVPLWLRLVAVSAVSFGLGYLTPEPKWVSR